MKTVEELEKQCFILAAHQCPFAVSGEYGHMVCTEILRLKGIINGSATLDKGIKKRIFELTSLMNELEKRDGCDSKEVISLKGEIHGLIWVLCNGDL